MGPPQATISVAAHSSSEMSSGTWMPEKRPSKNPVPIFKRNREHQLPINPVPMTPSELRTLRY